MEKGLLEKTGKTLDQWKKLVNETAIEKHGEIIKFLKEKHDFSHGFANFVAHKVRKSDAGSQNAGDLVSNQYKSKEGLKPIYDKLIVEIARFGSDITTAPKKDSVSIIRKRQFALIKPATKTRIDLGLKIKDQEPKGRLENSGPFGAMCTHRIQLTTAAEVDEEVIAWLRKAYDSSV
jgi:predicted transport protein